MRHLLTGVRCSVRAVGHARNDDLAHQSVAAAMTASDAPSFNMLRAFQHVSGALLLMQCDGDEWDEHLRNSASGASPRAPLPAAGHGPPPQPGGFGSPMSHLLSSAQPALAADAPADEPEISLAGNLWYGDGDGDDGGYDHQDGAPASMSPGEARVAEAPDSPPEEAEQPPPKPKDIYDPYAELDPHCPDTANDQPYKRRIPKEPRCDLLHLHSQVLDNLALNACPRQDVTDCNDHDKHIYVTQICTHWRIETMLAQCSCNSAIVAVLLLSFVDDVQPLSCNPKCCPTQLLQSRQAVEMAPIRDSG
jgi:hypothetical protein